MPTISEQPRYPVPVSQLVPGRPRTPDALILPQNIVHGHYLGGVAIVTPPQGASPSPDQNGTVGAQLTIQHIGYAAPPDTGLVMGALGRNPPNVLQPVQSSVRVR